MKKNLQNKNVLAYCRVSTKDQKDFGNSLTVQKNRIIEFCRSHEMNILKIFSEDYSAKNFNRPSFKELKAFVKANKVDYVIVHKWDRFSRNLWRALRVIEDFKKLGIEINSVESWIEYDTPDHIIMLGMYLSTPEAENSKIGERSRTGTRQALREGRYVKSHPKGYKSGLNSDGKPLMQPDPKIAPRITQLFNDYSTGLYSQQQLLSKYNKLGLKLTKSALSRLLSNPLYMGKVRVPKYKGEPEELVEGKHIALITPETFNVVQNLKKGKRRVLKKQRTKNPNFPLTGYLKCPECGETIYGSQSNNGKSKRTTRKYYYYQCNSKHKCLRYSAEVVHRELVTVFKSIQPDEEIIALFEEILISEYKNVKKNRKSEMLKLDKRIKVVEENQLMATEKFAIGKIDDNIYQRLIKKSDGELSKLKLTKAEYGDFQKDLDKFLTFGMSLLKNLEKFYEKADVEVKCQLLGSIFDEKLEFHKNSFRTLPFNEAISTLCKYNKGFKQLKIKMGDVKSNVSHLVLKAGIEPAQPKLLDFESSASTSSAT